MIRITSRSNNFSLPFLKQLRQTTQFYLLHKLHKPLELELVNGRNIYIFVWSRTSTLRDIEEKLEKANDFSCFCVNVNVKKSWTSGKTRYSHNLTTEWIQEAS